MSAVSFPVGHGLRGATLGSSVIECGICYLSPRSQGRGGLSLSSPGYRYNCGPYYHRLYGELGKKNWFETKKPSCICTPLAEHAPLSVDPLVFRPPRRALQSAGVCSHSIAISDAATTPPSLSDLLSWGRVCFALVGNRRPVMTPLSLSCPPSCGAPEHGAYDRGYASYHTPL